MCTNDVTCLFIFERETLVFVTNNKHFLHKGAIIRPPSQIPKQPYLLIKVETKIRFYAPEFYI